MNTPQEFEPLGYWMGWEKMDTPDRGPEWWGEDAEGLDDFKGYANVKTSLADAECIEALRRMVEKGYYPEMYYSVDSDGFAAWYFTENPCDRALYYTGETFSQAVEQCLKHLIKAERGGGEQK